MISSRRLLLALLFCSTAVAIAASSSGRWLLVPAKDHARINPLAATPQAIDAGAMLYHTHCSQCHGPTALGDGRKHPSLRTDRIHQATDGDIEWFLRQGDLAHGMPSWSSLPTSQRWQIIAYLRSLP